MSIYLNHAKSNHAANGWAIALLVSGCVLSAILFWHYLNLSNAINILQTELQQLTLPKQTLRTAKADSRTNAKDSAQAVAIKAAIVDIKTPWQHLLNPLEAATNDDIKLLSLESNAKTKQLRITAVTLTIDSMMAYINRLSTQPTLQQVHLISHEVINTNGMPVITFNVEALWQAQ